MSQIDATQAGTFKIGGDIDVVRLGFGAMRITGPGIWGPPQERKRRCAPCAACRNWASISSTRRIPTARTCRNSSSARRCALTAARHCHQGRADPLRPGQLDPKGNPDYLIGQARRSREPSGWRDRSLAVAPGRPRVPPMSNSPPSRAAGDGRDPSCGLERGFGRADQGGAESLSRRDGAEPL